MNIVALIFGIAFVFISILFWTGKRNQWISKNSNKSMPAEAFAKNISLVFLLAGVLFIFAGVSLAFRTRYFRIGMLAWFILTAIDIYWIERKINPKSANKK